MPEMGLKDKVAIVTGAGSRAPGIGNGRAAAILLAREGCKVAVLDATKELGDATKEMIDAEGGTCMVVVGNVADQASCAAAVKSVVDAWGRVDVLVNNVGIGGPMGNAVDTNAEAWDMAMRINVTSMMLMAKYAIPEMRKQGGGSIINISSIASIRHLGISYVTYATTKAAMNQMTRTTAVEFAPKNIRVNAVLPGLMKTPMVEHSAGLAASYAKGDVEAMWKRRDEQVPMGHMGDAWDVANAALFLASDESRYVTGIELIVDGGLTLKVS